MNRTKLLAAVFAGVVLIGGLAAVGAAMPADASSADETPDAMNETGNDAADERPGAVGPDDGLPEQVPDHVSAIHDTIESFLDGTVENLGEAISELTPGDEDDNDAASDAAAENGR